MAGSERQHDFQPAGPVRLYLTTAPPAGAEALARALVEDGLAACVNVVPGLRSLYRWKKGIQNDPESLLLIKTVAPMREALLARLLALHPYEVPEVLEVEPAGGLATYLSWVEGAATGGQAGAT